MFENVDEVWSFAGPSRKAQLVVRNVVPSTPTHVYARADGVLPRTLPALLSTTRTFVVYIICGTHVPFPTNIERVQLYSSAKIERARIERTYIQSIDVYETTWYFYSVTHDVPRDRLLPENTWRPAQECHDVHCCCCYCSCCRSIAWWVSIPHSSQSGSQTSRGRHWLWCLPTDQTCSSTFFFSCPRRPTTEDLTLLHTKTAKLFVFSLLLWEEDLQQQQQ